ncbi:MAG: 1,4-dihydroxy-6-naphthoate synthase [Chitinophagaceae bacterium]
MKLKIGFSPCPNDTFIFDALMNKKIDTAGFEFDIFLEDVETLNEWALHGKLDITKLSFPAFFKSLTNYVLLDSGSALGRGVGPLLISKDEKKISEIKDCTIAIPGVNTTANLLLGFALPEARKKNPMLFSEIENAVLNKKVDLGLIIHESRFTYQQKGLKKVLDLGEYWEEKMNIPIPLGGIAIRRHIPIPVAWQVDQLIRQSIEFAFSNYPFIPEYIKQHSQEMSEEVMRQHIELYVNNYSLNLGEEGRQAIATLFTVYSQMNGQHSIASNNLFLL